MLDRYKVYQGTRNLREKFERFTHQMKDDWGLATGENVLFGSDETSTLYLINRQNSKVIGKHIVTYNGHEVHNLNELEYIHGEVWANVWLTDCIARISPKDGTLLGWILISLRISGLDNLASVRLPTVVEGLQGRETVKEETGDDRPNPLR